MVILPFRVTQNAQHLSLWLHYHALANTADSTLIRLAHTVQGTASIAGASSTARSGKTQGEQALLALFQSLI